jgi:hypothetical protein
MSTQSLLILSEMKNCLPLLQHINHCHDFATKKLILLKLSSVTTKCLGAIHEPWVNAMKFYTDVFFLHKLIHIWLKCFHNKNVVVASLDAEIYSVVQGDTKKQQTGPAKKVTK